MKQCIMCKGKVALFGPSISYSEPEYCVDCKSKSMVLLYPNKCITENCRRKCFFNNLNNPIPLYCVKCSRSYDNMVNVVSGRFCRGGCGRQPSYNFKPSKVALYCNRCKTPGMKNVISKECVGEDCEKRPSFNYPHNINVPLYCKKCRLEGMIDVVNKRCKGGCGSQPAFNYENKPPAYCAKCKENGMINVTSKMCRAPGCTTYPSFNIPEESCPIYCGYHKKEFMVNKLQKYNDEMKIKRKMKKATSCDSDIKNFKKLKISKEKKTQRFDQN
eukprot:Pgem_evm2s19598